MFFFPFLTSRLVCNNFNRTSCLIKSINTKYLFKKQIKNYYSQFTREQFYKPVNIFSHSISYEENIMPSPKELTTFFKENKIEFEEGFTSYKIKCPLCQRKKTTQNSHLYINKPTGIFLCDTCNINGQWQILNSFLKTKFSQGKLLPTDIETLKEKYIFNNTKTIEKWNKIINQSKLLTSFTQDTINEILKQFNLPEVSKLNIEPFNIYYDQEQKQIYLPLKTISGDIGGFKTISATEEDTFPRKNCFGLIYVKQGRNKDEAIIVSRVSDALALSASKINSHIICLPYGITTLPIEILPILEKFKKITLWFQNDIQSWETSKNFAKKLNVKRCFCLRPFISHPAPFDALNSDINLKDIYKTSQPIWDKSIITFENLREDVYLALQNNEKIQGIKWKRFPTLTKLLKGHRRGELTVITGPTGSGKTTFISEYSLDLSIQGVNTLWGSFEIRNERLATTLLKQLSLTNLENHLDQFDYWADEFTKLPIYFLTFHGQQSIKMVMETLEHATYVHDINHVIIDNLQFMMGISLNESSDRFWKQDVIISGFRSFATKKNCHVTLVIHPRKERNEDDLTINSIFGTGKAVQEADNVLLIQDKRLLSVKGKKYLQVAKNRYSGDLGIMPLSFDKDSLSFALKKKTENKDESVQAT